MRINKYQKVILLKLMLFITAALNFNFVVFIVSKAVLQSLFGIKKGFSMLN